MLQSYLFIEYGDKILNRIICNHIVQQIPQHIKQEEETAENVVWLNQMLMITRPSKSESIKSVISALKD